MNTGFAPKIPTAWLWGYAFSVWTASLFLGLRFNRSRLFFSTLVLALSTLSLRFFSQGQMLCSGPGRDLFNILSLLIPFNLLWILFIKERGLLTPRGIIRISMILIQGTVLFIGLTFSAQNVSPFLEHLALFPKDWFRMMNMPQPVFLSYLLFSVASLALSAHLKSVMEKGFFWASLALLAAFWGKNVNDVSLFYLITSNLILLFSVIEASHRMAFKDELTGIPGRRALNDYFLKLGNHYTLAMADIDHFKKFNDRFGHDTGDEVLKFVASILSRVEGGGKAFRYGGEEFTLIFSGKSAKETLPHLEKLRHEIETYPFTLRRNKSSKKAKPQKVSVTMSFGAAERNEKRPSAEEVLKAADKALYKAKKNGRNQVVI